MARIVGVDLPKKQTRRDRPDVYLRHRSLDRPQKFSTRPVSATTSRFRIGRMNRSAQFVRRSRIWVSRSRANAVRSYSSISNADGYRLLPRHPSPSGSSRSRSVDQEQRPHPQGTQEDCRKQEKGNEVIIRELWQRKLEQSRRRLLRSVPWVWPTYTLLSTT